MDVAYAIGLFIAAVVWLAGTLASAIMWSDSYSDERKKNARIFLLVLFLGPVVVLTWPVALVGGVIYFVVQAARDALSSGD